MPPSPGPKIPNFHYFVIVQPHMPNQSIVMQGALIQGSTLRTSILSIDSLNSPAAWCAILYSVLPSTSCKSQSRNWNFYFNEVPYFKKHQIQCKDECIFIVTHWLVLQNQSCTFNRRKWPLCSRSYLISPTVVLHSATEENTYRNRQSPDFKESTLCSKWSSVVMYACSCQLVR